METAKLAAGSRPMPGWAVPAALYAVAFALRLIPAIWFPGINHPDEVFQTLEQSHRLVFGYGVFPWEFEFGARSWLLPGILAGPMWLGSLFGDGPTAYLVCVHLSLALLAAGIIPCAYGWGRNHLGFWGGVIAAALPALWPDDVYFAARSLSECVAAPILVIGFYLADPSHRPGDGASSRRRLLLAGILLGLTIALRLQLAPAIAVILLWLIFAGPRRNLIPMATGIAIALALAGGLDALTWDYPFESLWRNLTYNIFYGVSAYYGTEPWYFYIELLWQLWRGFIVVIVPLALIGARRLPVPFLAALALLAAHSAVPHKELRFIYPAILLLSIVAGMGLAQLAVWISARRRISLPRCAAAMFALTALCTVTLTFSPSYRALWRVGHDMVRADTLVARLDSVCGIGIWRSHASYTYFHRKVPFYWSDDQADFEKYLPAFNTLIAAEPAPPAPGFTVLKCFGDVCVAQRPGPCADIPMPPMLKPKPQAEATPG